MRSQRCSMLFYRGDPSERVFLVAPVGHRVLVYDTIECVDRMADVLRAKGLQPRVVELPRPLRGPDPRTYADGYAPCGSVRWATLFLPEAEFEVGAQACLSHGLQADWEFNCLSSAPPSEPANVCPACLTRLVQAAPRCPECGLRFVEAERLRDGIRKAIADMQATLGS